MKNNKALFHSLFLTAFSAAIFLPITGKGFIHDDFVHLFHAWSHSFWNGALTPSSGAFFTPITNMSFKMDWSLWGGTHPFPLALENLLLHLTVVLLLYALVARIWQSHYAAFWTSFGFSLLFPSDTWAVMWIATRAHILVAVFGLLGMHSVLSLAKSQRHRSGWIFLTLLCAVGAALSKENGVAGR